MVSLHYYNSYILQERIYNRLFSRTLPFTFPITHSLLSHLRTYDIFDSITSPQARDWNEEFQQLLSSNYANDPEKELDRTRQLKELCQEFAVVASRVGKVIISELFLDVQHKSIQSVTSKVGGVAGGQKVCE